MNEYSGPDGFSDQRQRNYEEAADKLAELKRAVEAETVAYNDETNPTKKKVQLSILNHTKSALRVANKAYNDARKAVGK